jgi:hypothetical protein
MSVVPWHCRVSYAIFGTTYSINPDDCTIVPLPQGTGTLTVRLPDTDSPVPPASGDFYLVNDALGLVNGSHALVVATGPTYQIDNAPSLSFVNPFSWLAVQFDARNKKWAVFQGKVA